MLSRTCHLVLLTLVLAGLWTRQGQAGEAGVAVLGDSLSVGLAQSIARRIPALPVRNYGVVSSGLSGKRPVDWQARVRTIAQTQPSYAIVMIGMNDSMRWPGLEYIRSTINFLMPLVDAHIPFELVSVPSTSDPVRNANIVRMNRVFEAIAHHFDQGFVELPEFPVEERAHDGIHFTSRGYSDLAGIVIGKTRVPRD